MADPFKTKGFLFQTKPVPVLICLILNALQCFWAFRNGIWHIVRYLMMRAMAIAASRISGQYFPFFSMPLMALK